MKILLRYDEIALRGANRKIFEKKLIQNIQKQIAIQTSIRSIHGRILLEASENHREWLVNHLSHVFGLTSFSEYHEVQTHEGEILSAVLSHTQKLLHSNPSYKKFCLKVRRSDKVFAESSLDLAKKWGSTVLKTFPNLKVDLENPEICLNLELRHNFSFIWVEKTPSPGGLPVGCNGTGLALFSGGIDSPVAALRMMSRGMHCDLIHFDGAPYVGPESWQKVLKIAQRIQAFSPEKIKVFRVPFGNSQLKIAETIPQQLRTLIYRALIFEVSSEFAQQKNYPCLITGESLGQVASQTTINLCSLTSRSKLPILRPFIGSSKKEIIQEAKGFGTLDLSLAPGADSCVLFTTHHPELGISQVRLEEEISKIKIWNELKNELLEKTILCTVLD